MIFRTPAYASELEQSVRFAIETKPAKFYPPRPNALCLNLLSLIDRPLARYLWKLEAVEVEGLTAAYAQIGPQDGVILAPNHSFEGDAYVLWTAARQLRRRFFYLAAWQTFDGAWSLKGKLLQRLGVFSIDRDGSDRRALRTAIDLLCNGQSLVAFPEGEIHHLNQRLTPFLDGVVFMAASAQRQLSRAQTDARVWIVPAGLRYELVGDVRPALEAAMARLERRMFWSKAAPGTSLHDRILHFGDLLLTVKEKDKLGRSAAPDADLPTRIAALTEALLSRHEARYLGGQATERTVALRVKALRRCLLPIYLEGEPGTTAVEQAREALSDIQLALQLYSYPGNYIADDQALLPMVETVEKFNEDVCGLTQPLARRRARIVFGTPIDLRATLATPHSRRAIAAQLETATAALLQPPGSYNLASPSTQEH